MKRSDMAGSQAYALRSTASPVMYRGVAQAGIFGTRLAAATIKKAQLLRMSERTAAQSDMLMMQNVTSHSIQEKN